MTLRGDVPETGLAMVMPAVGASLREERRPVVPPGPGEAVVRVDACGVCGSDSFLQQGGFGADKLPVVPGHEATGHVVAVGSDSDSAWVGSQVALYYIDSPQDSRWAMDGHENIGPDVRRMGVDVDGAFAEYVTRPLHTLVPVGEPMEPAVIAVATDALATPFHALTAVANVQPGETLAVIGLGGIGSNGVQIGRHLGARVVAVGRGAPKMALAEELGADVVVNSGVGADGIRAAAGGQVDVVLQCVGSPAMDRLAIDVAGYRARVVCVGTSLGTFELASTELVWRELALLGSRGFTSADIADVIGLVRDGALTVDHLLQHQLPLADANQALQNLKDPAVMRTVLITDSGRQGVA